MSKFDFDWSDLAFSSKKVLSANRATFMAAPRELSQKRFTELVKAYLPQGDIILGLAKEDYVLGFENQPQFKALQQTAAQAVIDKVNASASKRKIYTLHYFQREATYILEALHFKKIVFVNGSWKYTFHTRDVYYTLANKHADYELVSPFSSEQEAEQAAQTYAQEIAKQHKTSGKKMNEVFNERDMLASANAASLFSFDHSFQTGAALGKKVKDKQGTYEMITTAFNKVVPYQTYAMHHGSAREKHFSPPNDLNHYDTIHAEIALIIEAARQKIDLKDASLFINLMPCPTCARMLSETDIAECVYNIDHSDGYAVKMLELAGKTVRRVVI